MSDFATKDSVALGRDLRGFVAGASLCPIQMLDYSGNASGSPSAMPAWCATVARTRIGATVCNRGCGFSLRQAARSEGCAAFRCPFGVSNLMFRMDSPPMIAVGGRWFETYGQFRGFVERALDAGAALGDLLGVCGGLDFQTRPAMERVFLQALAMRDDSVEAYAAAEMLRPDLPHLGGGLVPGHPAWPELRLAQETLEKIEDPVQLQRALVEELSALSRAEKASLFLADPAAGNLVLAHAVGLPAAVRPGLRRSFDEGIMGQVFATHEPLVVENMADRPATMPSAHGHYRSASFACLPLISGADRLGVVNLSDRTEGLFFSRADMDWLRMAAQIGAGAARRLALSRRLKRLRSMGGGDSEEPVASPLVFEARLDAEFQRARRYRRTLSLVLLRVDMSGWAGWEADARVPELVRRGVAGVLGPAVRSFDQVMRYEARRSDLSGEHLFAVILPETPGAAARQVAARLLASAHERFLVHLPHQDEADAALVMSAGVAEYPTDAPGAAELRDAAESDLLRKRPDEAPPVLRADGLPDVECLPSEGDGEDTP